MPSFLTFDKSGRENDSLDRLGIANMATMVEIVTNTAAYSASASYTLASMYNPDF